MKISPDDLIDEDIIAVFTPSAEGLAHLKQFCMARWVERASERDEPVPSDLSYSCKFTSLMLWRLYGGTLRGNHDHQFVELDDGSILDLSSDARDVTKLRQPYRHDPEFFMNEEHRAALESCMPRVNRWLADLTVALEVGTIPRAAFPRASETSQVSDFKAF